MKKYLRIISLLAFISAFVLFPLKPLYTEASPRRADFGDFSGDSDFGDSGWDSGGSDWDSGGSWDSDSGSYSSSGSSGSASWGETIIVLAVIIVIIIASASSNKKKSSSALPPPVNTPALRRVEEYTQIDPSFNAEQFRDKVSNLYVQFQNAWQKKDLSPLRPYLTDTYYSQMDNQLSRYRNSGQTNIVDRITVLKTELMGWKQESGFDEMIVKLDTRIVDYVVDDNTGNIVRGSKTAEKFMTYEWTLVRTTGVTTSRSTGTTGQTCPYCGASVNINQSAVCEYCGSVLTTDKFDWAVSNIKALAQRTRQ
ncbi:MAG: Tim44 domain-containing protein [Ruminococcus sp.]|uniref:Tim44 domain-containing protein n=1 Tax=Ruminococcus sp. TaxID=41978 RepID=UPI0025D74FEA|nr:Tim44-like domain-containing protein [Ruminococcus sp.]MBR5682503.1 Tim44 domain-containing protein [Ruminococcus sp.]